MPQMTTHAGKAGQPEVRFASDDALVPREDGEQFRSGLEAQIRDGEVFRDGETMQIGWVLVKFEQRADGLLHLLEPNMKDVPIVFVDSLTTTLKHLRQQKDAVDSCQADIEPLFPSLRQTIVVSKNFEGCTDFFMTRDAPEDRQSGWFFRDISVPAAEQSEGDFDLVFLYDFGCRRPDLVKFLAFPVGYGIHKTAKDVFRVIHETREPAQKPGSYLAELNAALR